MLKWVKFLMAPLAVLALTASSARAATVQIGSFLQLNQEALVSYSGGPGGVLSVDSGADDLFFLLNYPMLASVAPAISNPAALALSGFNAVGSAVQAMPGGNITQQLNNGSFTISDANGVLLGGMVSDASLVINGSSGTTGSVLTGTFNYTSGSLLAFFAPAGLTNPGSFSIALTALTPGPTLSGGSITAFTASGTGTFGATLLTPGSSVPLPGVVWLGMTLLGGSGGYSLLRRRFLSVAA